TLRIAAQDSQEAYFEDFDSAGCHLCILYWPLTGINCSTWLYLMRFNLHAVALSLHHCFPCCLATFERHAHDVAFILSSCLYTWLLHWDAMLC
ncbi:hypothetical protein Ancab_019897, partial [Ancistrocladus abbreviatus]